MSDDPKRLTALERQNLDPGTLFFDTEEEMRAHVHEFNLVHEAVIAAVDAARTDDDDGDVDDLDDYDHLFEDPA